MGLSVVRDRIILLDTQPFPRATVPEEDLRAPEVLQYERLANVVRRIYIMLRSEYEKKDYEPGPRWDGGMDRYGARHARIWPRLAKFFIARGIEPLGYMKAQFWRAKSSRMTLPNKMMNDAAIETYEKYIKTIEVDLARWLQWEIGSVRSEMQPVQDGLRWDYERALSWALTNERTVKASPLTRYCLAVEYSLDTIAEVYHDSALFQYAFQKDAYDAAWPEGSIPTALQVEAATLVERILT